MKLLANPWVLLAAGSLWLASLVGVGMWQYHDGAGDVAADWEAAENEELRAALAEVARLQAEATAKERAHSEALSAIDKGYQDELKNANDSHRRVLDRLRAGELRLRDQYAAASTNCPGAAGGDAAPAGQRDGEAGTELSGEASRFLLDLTNEADDVARQLAAAQAVIEECRAQKKTPK